MFVNLHWIDDVEKINSHKKVNQSGSIDVNVHCHIYLGLHYIESDVSINQEMKA